MKWEYNDVRKERERERESGVGCTGKEESPEGRQAGTDGDEGRKVCVWRGVRIRVPGGRFF